MAQNSIREAVATGKVANLNAAEMKADICGAFYWQEDKEKKAVYVTASDSNGSRPVAWVIFKTVSLHDLGKMDELGWKLDMAWAENRKVKAMFSIKETE